jgi:hypothetical protein
LRRQRTTIGAESRTSWVEFEKSNLSLLDDEVSLRSSKAKDEEKSVIGEEDASVYTVEDDRHGFDLMTMMAAIPVIAVWTCTRLWYVEISIPNVNVTKTRYLLSLTLCYVRVSSRPTVRSSDHHRPS